MDNFMYSNVKNFRYERKFFINGVDRPFIETKLKFQPAMFKEIYHERMVNNIYFDSFNLKHYHDNLDGVGRRLKVRIRWYGDLFGVIENPILELKLRHNLNVGKLSYPLKSFTLDKNFTMNTLCEVFDVSSLREVLKLYLKSLSASLLNTYKRKYFLSSNGNYRVTIDTDMLVYKLFFL